LPSFDRLQGDGAARHDTVAKVEPGGGRVAGHRRFVGREHAETVQVGHPVLDPGDVVEARQGAGLRGHLDLHGPVDQEPRHVIGLRYQEAEPRRRAGGRVGQEIGRSPQQQGAVHRGLVETQLQQLLALA
jgi:hypothetical protein